MVIVAQLVRASDCGSEGRRFETGLSPFKNPMKKFIGFYFYKLIKTSHLKIYHTRQIIPTS